MTRRFAVALIVVVAAAVAVGPTGLPEPAEAATTRVHADFNGDGFSDLAVGIPDRGTHGEQGAVQVLYGSPEGVTALNDQLLTPETWYPPPREVTWVYWLGWSLTVGHFDGDEYADLAISAPASGDDEQEDRGLILVAYGSPAGLAAREYERSVFFFYGDTDMGSGAEGVGRTLVAGDFDDDGFDEVIAGGYHLVSTNSCDSPRYSSLCSRGRLYQLKGSAAGLRWPTCDYHRVMCSRTSIRESSFGDSLGDSLAVGDFNADGVDDLAAGNTKRDVDGVSDAGSVVIIRGRPRAGLDFADPRVLTARKVGGVLRANDHFGRALTTGDFNVDNASDLVVARRTTTGDGVVHEIPGSGTGLRTSRAQAWSQKTTGILGMSESGDDFGAALGTGDLDRDGAGDLVLGVPGEDARAGRIAVLHGRAAHGLTRRDKSFGLNSPGVPRRAAANDHFGAAVTVAEFGKGGFSDVAVGAPGADLTSEPTDGGGASTKIDAGAVLTLYGTAESLGPAEAQEWHPDITGVEGDAEGNEGRAWDYGDSFGAALVQSGWQCQVWWPHDPWPYPTWWSEQCDERP